MDWSKGWRERAWNELDQDWDVVIIGGGITGAGILRQAVHAGLKVLLVEAVDFASGTSSRSSKLVHGGMRYLKNAQVKVTLESVNEREYLLKQGRGLVNRLGFLYPCLESDKIPGWVFGAGLAIYDLMAHQWSHRSYDVEDMQLLCPYLTSPLLRGGFRFFDAQTDDARLVLRLIRESMASGGYALNYTPAVGLLHTKTGKVCGLVIRDASGEVNRDLELQAKVVINATGAWADEFRGYIGLKPRLRPLRGSHLIFQSSRIPITRAVTFLHPLDGRPVFVLPWENVIVYGTTDVDQGNNLLIDPPISNNEIEYLMEGLQAVFPTLELTQVDITATFSGIRPVVDTGKANPSKESREHVIWDENGLLTVSGGKLTTFRIMGRDALRAVKHHLGTIHFDPDVPVLNPLPPEGEAILDGTHFPAVQCLRLLARYGVEACKRLCARDASELDFFHSTPYLRAEVRHAASSEGVVHLDDLLLRRVRLGLLLPGGGLHEVEELRNLIQNELGWTDEHWSREVEAYRTLWRASYSL